MAKDKLIIPEQLKDVERSDLVQLSRELLEKVVRSSDILSSKKMTVQSAKEAKVVLGFLNACTNTMKTKMQFFKMVGIGEKVKAVQQVSKKIR